MFNTKEYLPTKFNFNEKKKEMNIFCRKKDDIQLHKFVVPFEHSCFMRDPEGEYKLLIDDGHKYDLYNIDTKEIRYLRDKGDTLGEADVKPAERFVLDMVDKLSDEIKPRIFFLDIEVYGTDGNMPSWINIQNFLLNAITIYDTYYKQYTTFLLLPYSDESDINFNVMKEIVKEGRHIIDLDKEVDLKCFKSEYELIESVLDYFTDNVPDIITCWNSPFDIPVLVKKIYNQYKMKGLNQLSPFNRTSYRVIEALEKFIDLKDDQIIPGISVIDYLKGYKKFSGTEQQSYSLDNIALMEIGKRKVQYEGDLFELWKEDISRFLIYNIIDVNLMIEIDNKFRFMDIAVAVRNITKIEYHEIYSMKKIVDMLFLQEAKKRRDRGENVVLPSGPLIKEKYEFAGAYVKPTKIGRYKWLSDLDFKSLYPSIIATFNLSPETFIGKVVNFKYLNKMLYKGMEDLIAHPLTYNEEIEGKIIFEGRNKKRKDFEYKEFIKFLKSKNCCVLPNGAVFHLENKNAIMPTITKSLVEMRDVIKQRRNKAEKEGNADKAKGFDIIQNAYKIIGNSVYGIISYSGFRLFSLNIAEGITTSGQALLKYSIDVLNKYLNERTNKKKDYIVAGDTDSLIFTLEDFINVDINNYKKEDLEKLTEIAVDCQNFVNNKLNYVLENIFRKIYPNKNYLQVKQEWIAKSGIFTAKKRYITHLVFKEGLEVNKIDSKGVVLRRSDTPKVTKLFVEKIINAILSYQNKDEIDEIIKEEVYKIRNDLYSYDQIGFPISVNGIDTYKVNSMHVKGAKIFNQYFAHNERDKINYGRVKVLPVKKWKMIKELNEIRANVITIPSDSDYGKTIGNHIELDYERLQNRLVKKIVAPYYTALGWAVDNTLFNQNANNIKKAFRKTFTKGGK